MSKPKSENEIKMTFGEAIAITQQTYNYFKLIKKEKRRDRKNFSNTLNLRLKKYIKLNQCIDKTKKEHYEKNFQECNQCIINKFEDFNQSVIEKIKELKITNQDTHAKFVELKKIIDQSTSGKFEELKTTIYQDIKSFDEVEKQINQLQERKIKIENDIQQTENDDIRNLNNEEIGNFKLYSITYDEKSNFSGITYINEREDAIDVAIACRGTAERIDWIQNLAMPFFRNTCSDRTAQAYATKILAKIRKQHQNKQINVITLGHSKGGREAQKQMLALLDTHKDDNKVNICCLTFNSAPVFPIIPILPPCLSITIVLSLLYFFGFWDTFLLFLAVSLGSNLYFNEKEKKYGNNCLNLVMSDSTGLLCDILALVSSRRYGKQHGYANHNKEIVPLVSIIGSYLICYILDVLYKFGHFPFLKNLTDPAGLKQLLNLPLFIVFVVIIAIYVIGKLHSVNSFKDKSSYFEDLNGAKISDILGMKDEDNLTKLAQKRLWKQYKPEVRDIIEKNNKDYIEKKSFLCKSKNREASDSILLNIIPNETIGEIIHISEEEIVQKGTGGMIRVHKKGFFKDGVLNQIKKGDRRVIEYYFNKKTKKIEYTLRRPFLYFF